MWVYQVYNASEYHCSRIKGKNLFKEALGKSPFSSRVEFARGIALSGGHPGAESTRSLDKAREKAKEVAVACLAAFEANPGGIRSEMTYNFLPWVGGDNRITLRQALEVMVGDLAFRVLRIDDTGSIPEDSVFPLRSSVIHLLQNANLTRCIEALSAGIVDPDEDKSSVDLQLPLGHLPTVAEGLLSEGASAVRMFEVGKCLRRGLGATGFTGEVG